MSPEVSRDHIPPAGGVGALGAAVGLLARVRPLVSAQVIRPGEDLAADAASVRLETRVEPHVSRQHVGPGKGPLAHFALVALDHHRTAARFARCAAGRTLGRRLLLERLVTGRQMFDEPVVLGEDLAAHFAAEARRGHGAGLQVAANVQIGGHREVVREGDAPREHFEPRAARTGRRRRLAQRHEPRRRRRLQAAGRGRKVADRSGSAGRQFGTGHGSRARVAARLVGAVGADAAGRTNGQVDRRLLLAQKWRPAVRRIGRVALERYHQGRGSQVFQPSAQPGRRHGIVMVGALLLLGHAAGRRRIEAGRRQDPRGLSGRWLTGTVVLVAISASGRPQIRIGSRPSPVTFSSGRAE